MHANSCSFTGRVLKKPNAGLTKQNLPVCSANVVIENDVVIAVQAFGTPARILGQANPGQSVSVIGVVSSSDARQRFEVKASSIALVPTEEPQ